MNNTLLKRDSWADILKAIAIVSVVIGHTLYTGNVFKAVYLFHLPLFFFVAGYLFNFSRYEGNSELLIARSAKRLLVPCVVMSLIMYDFYFWFSAGILSVLYGSGVPVSLRLGGLIFTISPILLMMWFLYCLFVMRLLLWGFLTVTKRLRTAVWINLALALVVARAGIMMGEKFPLPWSFDLACVGLFFAYAGYCVRSFRVRQSSLSVKHAVLGLIGAVLIYLDWQHGQLYLNDREYRAPFIALLGALSCIGLIGCLTEMWVRKALRESKLYRWLTTGFVYIGANSLVVMFVHIMLWEGRNGWWLVLLRLAVSLAAAELLARNAMLSEIFGAKTWKQIKQECAGSKID